MMKEIRTPNAPAAIGPYSQAIAATGTAVYVSGQLPIDPKTGKAPETRQSLENVKAILVEARYTLQDVVQATVLLADINDFAAMNKVYGEYFNGICPARAAFQVAALPTGAKVEIGVTAVK